MTRSEDDDAEDAPFIAQARSVVAESPWERARDAGLGEKGKGAVPLARPGLPWVTSSPPDPSKGLHPLVMMTCVGLLWQTGP